MLIPRKKVVSRIPKVDIVHMDAYKYIGRITSVCNTTDESLGTISPAHNEYNL